MLSIRKICLEYGIKCCFYIEEEEENQQREEFKQGTNLKDIRYLSSSEQTHQLEHIDHSFKANSLINPSETPTLKLIILDSKSFEVGTEFTINQNGLDSSKSNTGSVIIGSDPGASQIILSDTEKGVGSQHFVIKHDKCYRYSYAVKDLGNGTGTFIRIEKKLDLKDGNVISFGDSHMIISVGGCEDNKIHLKFVDGPRKDQSL